MILKITVTLLLVCGLLFGAEKTMTDPFHSLPRQINGWNLDGDVRIYTPDNLFEYINGGAELYISYGFERLWVRKYTRADYPEISVDIFDMGHPYRAFGVYSHGRETDDRLVGQGGEYNSGLLTFWQDRYYTSVLVYPEDDASRETVLHLGRAIATAIGRRGDAPPLLNRLPADGLEHSSVRYILHHAWINGFYYISDQNILNINRETEAVLAKYRSGKSPLYLLLVSYPNQAAARLARTKFSDAFLFDAATGIKQIEDGRWAGCRLEANRVWIVLNGEGAAPVTELLDLAVGNQ